MTSSAPVPSSRRGPTDIYEKGGAQQVELRRGAPSGERRGVLRRVPERNVLCRLMFVSMLSSGGVSVQKSRSVSPMFTTFAPMPLLRATQRHVRLYSFQFLPQASAKMPIAYSNALATEKLEQSMYFVTASRSYCIVELCFQGRSTDSRCPS